MWDEDGRWARFVDHLEKTHPEYEYSDFTVGHGMAGYVVRVWPPQARGPFDGTVAVAMVSYFAPVYSIYISEHWGPRGKHAYQTHFAPANPFEEELVSMLARKIEETFGVAEFPPELADVLVPDVSAGYRIIGKTTLYDCLFTHTP